MHYLFEFFLVNKEGNNCTHICFNVRSRPTIFALKIKNKEHLRYMEVLTAVRDLLKVFIYKFPHQKENFIIKKKFFFNDNLSNC